MAIPKLVLLSLAVQVPARIGNLRASTSSTGISPTTTQTYPAPPGFTTASDTSDTVQAAVPPSNLWLCADGLALACGDLDHAVCCPAGYSCDYKPECLCPGCCPPNALCTGCPPVTVLSPSQTVCATVGVAQATAVLALAETKQAAITQPLVLISRMMAWFSGSVVHALAVGNKEKKLDTGVSQDLRNSPESSAVSMPTGYNTSPSVGDGGHVGTHFHGQRAIGDHYNLHRHWRRTSGGCAARNSSYVSSASSSPISETYESSTTSSLEVESFTTTKTSVVTVISTSIHSVTETKMAETKSCDLRRKREL